MTNQDESLFKFEVSDGIARIGSNLTKREYFAAMVMQGILSHPGLSREVEMDRIAAKCIEQADALITELNRTEDKKHGE